MTNEEMIKESIQTLNLVNYRLADLVEMKEQLEKKLADLIEHPDDGQKTYQCDQYKVTLSTGYIYSLDKEEIEPCLAALPACFNPVRTKLVYEVDKKVMKDAEKYASNEEMLILSKLVSKKPKKLHVRISAGV